MRVVSVSTLLPETNYFRYLANALQKIGCKVLVYADKNPKNLKTEVKNVNLVWSKNIFYPWQIITKALKERSNLIHLHHEINLFGGLPTAFLFPVLLLLLRIFRFPIVTTIHAPISQKQIDTQFLGIFSFPQSKILVWPVKIFFYSLFFLTAKLSNVVIVHSEGLKKILVGEYCSSENKIVVIPHGVPDEISRQSSAISRQFEKWKPFILYFGYIHRRKGLEYLIKAFKLLVTRYPLPDTHLIIAGGAAQESYLEELKALVERQNLKKQVIFTGFVSLSKLRWLLENCQFVVLPAVYSIAGSGPLAQVIAHHRPVICTKIGVFGEEIKEGENGLFCEPNNAESLKEAMVKLIEDENLYQRLVKGMEKMHQERCWSKIAKETVEVYNDLLPKT